MRFERVVVRDRQRRVARFVIVFGRRQQPDALGFVHLPCVHHAFATRCRAWLAAALKGSGPMRRTVSMNGSLRPPTSRRASR
ncbi:hypothetical protein BGV61_25920 [Burkholderia ubonensis]|nr:hypothetical protein BGV61_25920 [Burkholderia ubonensis]